MCASNLWWLSATCECSWSRLLRPLHPLPPQIMLEEESDELLASPPLDQFSQAVAELQVAWVDQVKVRVGGARPAIQYPCDKQTGTSAIWEHSGCLLTDVVCFHMGRSSLGH